MALASRCLEAASVGGLIFTAVIAGLDPAIHAA
jgi:hypothetical protein